MSTEMPTIALQARRASTAHDVLFEPKQLPEDGLALIKPSCRLLCSPAEPISCTCLLVLGPVVQEPASQVHMHSEAFAKHNSHAKRGQGACNQLP